MSSKKIKKRSQKGKQLRAEQAVAAAAASRLDSAMFSRFGPYIKTLYDPDNPGEYLAPSVHTHQGDSRRKPIVFSHVAATDNETVIFKMYPRPTKTLVKSFGGATPAPSVLNSVYWEFEGVVAPQSVVGLVGRSVLAFGGQGAQDFELPLVAALLGGQSSLAVEASTAATDNVPYIIVNRGDYGLRVNPYYQDAVTDVWTAGATFGVPAGATLNSSTGAVANGIKAWGFNVHNASDTPRFLRLSISWNVSIPGVISKTLTYPAVASSAISALDVVQTWDEFRTTAMSMLLTFTGDPLTAGGLVACALVPREFVPDPLDPVGSIAQLAQNNYDGKLIDGCHIVWQPRTVDDFKYQKPEFDDGSYYIIIAANLAHADTSIRLRASYNYEFFSLDPNLGNMRYCPSAFGLDEVTQVVFSQVSPASSNDGHLKKLRAALEVAKKIAMMPLDWVRENPDKAMEMGAGIVAKLMAL